MLSCLGKQPVLHKRGLECAKYNAMIGIVPTGFHVLRLYVDLIELGCIWIVAFFERSMPIIPTPPRHRPEPENAVSVFIMSWFLCRN